VIALATALVVAALSCAATDAVVATCSATDAVVVSCAATDAVVVSCWTRAAVVVSCAAADVVVSCTATDVATRWTAALEVSASTFASFDDFSSADIVTAAADILWTLAAGISAASDEADELSALASSTDFYAFC
jgi:hypothetical protein